MAMRGESVMGPCCQGHGYRARVRQLHPVPADVDPAEVHAAAHRVGPGHRPWVLVTMITSIDGATATEGLSGGLGGPADKAVFSAIRSVADVILVAAGTARAEGYGPPRNTPERRAARLARGQTAVPRLAVVTRTLDLDPESPMFTDAVEPPLVLTVAGAPAERAAALADRAEVVTVGDGDVAPDALLAALHQRGTRVVVAEGGPTLNGLLVAADVVDEVNLTVSPLLVAGASTRMAHGAEAVAQRMRLAHLWAEDDLLFARYVRR
jgi:riboflavin biosynthesis pyrimidine reductase